MEEVRMIEVDNISVHHGYSPALKGVSVQVPEASLVVLIGSNGAGKTTLLRTIMGFHSSRFGRIKVNGIDITRKTTVNIVKLGVTLVPEGRQIFPDQTVLDNLLLGAYCRRGTAQSKQVKEDVEKLMERFQLLKERRNQLAGTLSGGEQQILAICRGLMLNPHFLLLDEPSLGLDQYNMTTVFEIIKGLPPLGIGVLLAEQAVERALSIADSGYVLGTGKVVVQGSARVLLERIDEIKRLYLGVKLD